MPQTDDSYQTITNGQAIASAAQAQFTEQRSRFISFAWHVTGTDQVKSLIAELQKEYYDARHVCYAYMLGPNRLDWRAVDNGEPSGTAGKPILGQINSAGLTDILVAVVRYFGGVKLGTSGLIEAYRRAAAQAIAAATIETRYIMQTLTAYATYDSVSQIMRVAKDYGIKVEAQDYGTFTPPQASTLQAPPAKQQPTAQKYDCRMELSMRQSAVAQFQERIKHIVESQAVPRIAVTP